MKEKLLTKSRFKVALECPTKLYYLDKKEYVNNSLEDPFLQALAEGGFQVGALAKCYYPQGIEVEERDYDKSVEKTNKLLKKTDVVIFEAAFRYKDFFVRTDVLVKKGNKIRIIEVKAKSFDPNDPKSNFITKNKKFIKSGWIPYLYDIAFQKYVAENSFVEQNISKSPEITAFLMLADKSKKASIDGLNQKFLVLKDKEGKTSIKLVGDVSETALGDKLLTEIPVEDCLELIYTSDKGKEYLGAKFEDYIKMISKYFKQDKKINSPLGKICKSCEFNTDEEDKNHKSGFKECWKEKAGLKKKDFEKQLVYNIWFYRDTDNKFEAKEYFMDDLEKEDFGITESIEGHQLSRDERQWLQVDKYKNKDNTPYIFKDGLKAEMESWVYPLHFIDFETTAIALPFNKGLGPYEGIASQFSHHIVYEDGTIEHKGEYLYDRRGEFPSFDFLRALKNELDKDKGSIFRYAAHENTYMNLIYRQLKNSLKSEVPDKDELMQWIQTISTPTDSAEDKWKPIRDMIDMKYIVEKYFYSPLTNGSNSIKQVLPAVLNSSKYLQDKYSKPIYGAVNGINSYNYKDWVWVKYDGNNNVLDPYKLLPPIFDKNNDNILDRVFSDDAINGGGAAMIAYAKMQFSEMTDDEREKTRKALLRYCELDTFAMVLIWEYWNNLINN